MGLRDKFIRFMSEYRTVFDHVWSSGIFTHEFGDFVRRDVAKEIGALAASKNMVYSSKGSVGQTKWTPVPWIAVFDTRITRKATENEYIVYLLNSETKELYLTFNQAAESKNSKAVRKQLHEKAQHIRNSMSLPKNVSLDPIVTGNGAYDAGCICSIKYTLSTLPGDDILSRDLLQFLDIYAQYYDIFYSSSSPKQWWPTLSEYDPQITKEKWLEMLYNQDILGDNIRRMLAAMYAQGGAASCA